MYYQIHSENLLNTVFQTFLSYYFCLAPCLDVVSNKLLNGSEFQSKPMFQYFEIKTLKRDFSGDLCIVSTANECKGGLETTQSNEKIESSA